MHHYRASAILRFSVGGKMVFLWSFANCSGRRQSMLRPTLILMAVLCWMPVLAGGQKPTTPPALRPEPGATSPRGPIQLDVVVTDKSGKPMAGLSQSDFTLLDNNRPASILNFHAYGGAQAPPPRTDPTNITS
jgi:hypothetical protein